MENALYLKLKNVIRDCILPLILYLLIFSILTFPMLLKFSTHIFGDRGDAMVHLWNLWWVNKAVTELHTSPWYTDYLHYPYGISLLGHTLSPFNGFIGIGLLKFLSLVETYNLIVIFSFVLSGLAAFWMSYYLTRDYWGSIIAGAIFTFSNYHFAHAEGHLNLISLEWIPLFVLCWHLLITSPTLLRAFSSGILLFLILLCDYYYFLCSVLAACIIIVCYVVKKRSLFFLEKRYLIPFVLFLSVFVLLAWPLLYSLSTFIIHTPLWGSHSPELDSLDPFSLIIPGGHWKFAHLTGFYWSRLSSNIHETSVHIGLSVLFMLIYVWIKRKDFNGYETGLLHGVFVFFIIMSMGPYLHIWGKDIRFIRGPYTLFKMAFPFFKLSEPGVRITVMASLTVPLLLISGYIWMKRRRRGQGLWFWYIFLGIFGLMLLEAALHLWGKGVLFIKLPYTLLEKAFPFLKIAGSPIRMVVMAILASSVIAGIGFKAVFKKRPFLAAILLVMLVFEYLPRPIPCSELSVPEYIRALRDLQGNGGVIDKVSEPSISLYYQTIHGKPLAFGDVSRIPEALVREERKIKKIIQEKDYASLYRDYNFRYLITPSGEDIGLRPVYEDGMAKIFDLKKE